MQLTELAELIRSRRSIREWQAKDVPMDTLLQAVELATWAPNGGNQQNWFFYIITKREVIEAMAGAVRARAERLAAWPQSAILEDAATLGERASFFRGAPAIIAVAAGQYQSPVDGVLAAREFFDPAAADMRRWRNTANSRVQSVASGIAYLLLILHQMGLGAVWMTGPLQAKAELERILGVPPDRDLIALVAAGYPAETPPPGARRPVGEVCQVIR